MTPRAVQLRNPRTGRYVKVDRARGVIVGHKATPGPYRGVPVVGRLAPYTERGIARVPCVRCGAPSVHQWSACANGNRWVGLCDACDVAVNALVLKFLRVPRWPALVAAYRRRMGSGA